jgi:hypothetical protein
MLIRMRRLWMGGSLGTLLRRSKAAAELSGRHELAEGGGAYRIWATDWVSEDLCGRGFEEGDGRGLFAPKVEPSKVIR